MAIHFYGDPHGEWRPLLRADLAPGDCLVIVGDMGFTAPPTETLAPLYERGVHIRWILGNHDFDEQGYYDHATEGPPESDLGGRVQHHVGVAVAGLGGVFKASVWYPLTGSEPPVLESRAAALRSLPHQRRWRRGLPLAMRGAVFPCDVSDLARRRADVLVSHEAPSCHKYGFAALDGLAGALRAQWLVHGHHHGSYDAVLPSGIRVRGLAKTELWTLPT